jgi:hypothetical protein
MQMKQIYAYQIDPSLIQQLKQHGFNLVISQELPSAELVSDQVLFFSSSEVEPTRLTEFKMLYSKATLIYAFETQGIAGWQAVAIQCQQLEIHFLRPGIGIEAAISNISAWMGQQHDSNQSVIGVFGVTPGIGATTVAGQIAQALPDTDTTLLGLNVFNPGWDKPATSLDKWRPRLMLKSLTDADIRSLEQLTQYHYLPGSADPLLALDYTESEIEYLTQFVAKKRTVVADYGAIPHSAAWVSGVQQSAIRIMVAHPNHMLQLERLMRLSADLGVDPGHWFLVCNLMTNDDMSAQLIAQTLGMQLLPLSSIAYKERPSSPFKLQLARKELDQLKQSVSLISETQKVMQHV